MTNDTQDKHNKREAYIVALYLSKFDRRALDELGFEKWNEAFIKIANSLGSKDATIKNNRDYFDTLFPNKRKGWHKKKSYKIVRDIYQEFSSYDFETLSKIVKDILDDNWLFNSYAPPSIAHLSLNQREQLQNSIKEEKQQKQKDRNPVEARYVLDLLEQEGGEKEVPVIEPESNLVVGIADIVTKKEVIEVKYIRNWKHAVGQVFAYWYYLSLNSSLGDKSLTPRVHLFGGEGIYDEKFKLCQSLMYKVFSPYTDSIVVTHAEEDNYWDEI